MKNPRQIKTRIRLWPYLLIGVIVFMTGAISSYLYFKPRLALKIPLIEDIESQRLKTRPPEGERLKDKGLSIEEGREPVNDAVRDVVRNYMKPYNVRLLDMYVKDEIVFINLSGELRRNFKGDAFEELGIIAGLYKGLKENIPEMTAMKILIEGKDVESFGGHIDISRPVGDKLLEGVLSH